MKERNAAHWEKKLNIRTTAADYEKDDSHHSRYEATAYAVLERLASEGGITRQDVLLDYGCGKGRVGFFMNYATGCGCIGVEYNQDLHARTVENLEAFAGRDAGRISFECVSAEDYIPDAANCFYFFNPFSVRILQGVLGRILQSWYAHPRRMRLYFYYALDDYLALLMTHDSLRFCGSIDCRDLFYNADEREKILIFEIEG